MLLVHHEYFSMSCQTVYSHQLVTVMQAQNVLGNKWTKIAKVVSGSCVFLS
jgi:hypothetical protein